MTKLVELFSDKLKQTVGIYEEFLNEHDRQIQWKRRYKKLSEENYKDVKETYSYQYEVWKSQINVFKALLLENIKQIKELIPQYTFYIKEYDILSYSQYLDILEDRKISNTWYLILSISDRSSDKRMSFVFYFDRFKFANKFNFGKADSKVVKRKPQIKLYLGTRTPEKEINNSRDIDLVNIGTWGDQLSFGVRNRNFKPGKKTSRASIITVKENPSKIIRTFIDQILYTHFNLGKPKTKI